MEKVHARLAALCRKTPIEMVQDWIEVDGWIQDTWAVAGDNGWVMVRDKDSLNGKHAHCFISGGGDDTVWDPVTYQLIPTFTCHNFYYTLPWQPEDERNKDESTIIKK
ncbi:unnamed protein product, partial [Mesorhabditis spiculigera]